MIFNTSQDVVEVLLVSESPSDEFVKVDEVVDVGIFDLLILSKALSLPCRSK